MPEVLRNFAVEVEVALAEVEEEDELLDGLEFLEVDDLPHPGLGRRRHRGALHLRLDRRYQLFRCPGRQFNGIFDS